MRWPRAFRSEPVPVPPTEAHPIDTIEELLRAAQAAVQASMVIVDGLGAGTVAITADEVVELKGGLIRHLCECQQARERLVLARQALGVPRRG